MSFDIQSAFERWTPPETFKFPLGDGDTLEFRTCQSYGEYRDLERDAGRWAVEFQGYPGSKSSLLPPYSNWFYLPRSHEEAVAAFIISELSHSPKLDISTACSMLKRPLLVDAVMKSIRIAHRDASLIALNAGVESEKKDSPEILTPELLSDGAGISTGEATTP